MLESACQEMFKVSFYLFLVSKLNFQCTFLIFRLQNLFSNLTIDDLLLVKQICLRASALQLVLIVKDKNQSALAPCQLLLHIASDASAFLEDNPSKHHLNFKFLMNFFSKFFSP